MGWGGRSCRDRDGTGDRFGFPAANPHRSESWAFRVRPLRPRASHDPDEDRDWEYLSRTVSTAFLISIRIEPLLCARGSVSVSASRGRRKRFSVQIHTHPRLESAIAVIQIFYSPNSFSDRYYLGMSHAAKTPKDVLDFAKKNDAKQVDLRFTDLPGLQHH